MLTAGLLLYQSFMQDKEICKAFMNHREISLFMLPRGLTFVV